MSIKEIAATPAIGTQCILMNHHLQIHHLQTFAPANKHQLLCTSLPPRSASRFYEFDQETNIVKTMTELSPSKIILTPWVIK